jgi:hypothetical protein
MGLSLWVGSKTKIYFVETKLRGKTIRVTIGRHDVFSLKDARVHAKNYRLHDHTIWHKRHSKSIAIATSSLV